MISKAAVLDSVRAVLGAEDYDLHHSQWERAAAEDVLGLEKAVKDLRAALTRGPIANRGGWLWRGFLRETNGHRRIAESRRS